MSWIRSEKALLHHPKTAHLKVLLNVETATVIGRLHMLWWWCLDYALDGDLSKKEPKVIEDSCQIPLKMLKKAGFVDSRPFRRIHDWWANQGNYLKLRFRDQPEIWQRIKDSYERDLHMGKHMGTHMGTPMGKTVDVDLHTDVRCKRTDVDLKDARALGPSARASRETETPEIKAYEDAKENEPCGPPKDLWKKITKTAKKITPVTD